ncbi:hypothetical protein BSLA_02r5076 [Burkholderia stabilis]|nr:hypothetical protein BSLA_02r5076 [Burkholderia stabilis]
MTIAAAGKLAAAAASRRRSAGIGKRQTVARATTALRVRRPAANPLAPPHAVTHAPMPTCRIGAPARHARIPHPKNADVQRLGAIAHPA